MEDIDFKSKSFRQAFWDWFDSLPKTDRRRFQEHSADMAELYFYNKFYKKRMSYNGNTSAFQAEAVGSIPIVRSKVT